MTPQDLKTIGSRALFSTGNNAPGMVVPAEVTIATRNPIGLIVVSGLMVLEKRGDGTRSIRGHREPRPIRPRLNASSGCRTEVG